MSGSGQGNMNQQSSTSGTSAGAPISSPVQNLQFDLVSTLYHALEGNATIQQYIQDANQMGNNEAAQFFQMVAQQDQERAQKARDLLFKLGPSGGSSH